MEISRDICGANEPSGALIATLSHILADMKGSTVYCGKLAQNRARWFSGIILASGFKRDCERSRVRFPVEPFFFNLTKKQIDTFLIFLFN